MTVIIINDKCNSKIDEKIRDEILIEKNIENFVIYLGRYQLYSSGIHFKNYMGSGLTIGIQKFQKLKDSNIKMIFYLD